MNLELVIFLMIAAPFLGAIVTALAPKEEKRWTVVVALLVTMSTLGLAFVTTSGTSDAFFGPLELVVSPFTLTVGPALVLGRLALALCGGRTISASRDNVWFLLLLSIEFIAIFTMSPAILLVAEGLSALLLASRLFLRGQKSQGYYLIMEILILCSALPAFFEQSIPEFSDMPPSVGLALIIAGFLRLGIFPLSTGAMATLSKKFDTTALISVLPVGGVLLLIRFGPTVNTLSSISNQLEIWLEIAAPLLAAMAIAQKTLPRAFGYTLFASHALLALLALDTGPYHVAIAGEFWAAILLSGTGLGAAAYLISLRFGDVNLRKFSGFQKHTPRLSVLFLVLGFALAGAPGTLQFVAEDFLLNTAELDIISTILVVTTISLMGFAVLRMHFRLFYGRDLLQRDFMRLEGREVICLAALTFAILMGGLLPSSVPLVSSVRAQKIAAKSPAHSVQGGIDAGQAKH